MESISVSTLHFYTLYCGVSRFPAVVTLHSLLRVVSSILFFDSVMLRLVKFTDAHYF